MKLWDKGRKLDKGIELFTVGNDYALDQALVEYDCKASIAHAKMLAKIRVISSAEAKKLEGELRTIIDMSKKGKFDIKASDEDCHTKIENHLVSVLGNLGKKIHTGRSRNDQVLAALRLYEKHELKGVVALIGSLRSAIGACAKKYGSIALPGYTHMRKAMPTTIKDWFSAYDAALQDDEKIVRFTLTLIDKSPLGSGAGFGIPVIGLDKKWTAKELGFSSVMETMYCQNSRGKYEALIVDALSQVMMDLNKIASDLILFSMGEFGYFSLPPELCTGSSIMPQKKNPDVLELLRAKYGVVAGYSTQIKMIYPNLISGYNRDMQLTKEPLMKAIGTTKDCLSISALLFGELVVDKDACAKALTPEVYATEEAYNLVKKGVPFRDAYKEIGKKFS